MLDITAAVRQAIIDDTVIADLLASYRNSPAVFTRRPVPEDAPYPLAVSDHDVSIRDRDWLDTQKPVITRNIYFYGEQRGHYRDVQTMALRARELFHRNPSALCIDGYHTIEITVTGPFDAPVADDQNTGRAISLTVQLQELS